MTTTTPILFAYGTLREPRLLEGVLGHPLAGLSLWPAVARGFRTMFYPGRIYPALVTAEGAVTEGLAVAGLSAADLAVLDLFEGDEYVRSAIGISPVAGGGVASLATVPAAYYRPVAAIGADAPAWSFDAWRRDHGEAMIVAEGESAAALRSQLIAMGDRDRWRRFS